MAIISTVVTAETLGREGMRSTSDSTSAMETKHATATALYFGRAVILGAADGLVVHPSGSAGVFAGIVCEDLAISPDLQTTANTVPAGYDAQILRRGRLWVVPEEDVVAGEAVCYRHASSGALPEALGRFRNDTDGGDATAIPSARWVTGGLAGTLAQLEINLP